MASPHSFDARLWHYPGKGHGDLVTVSLVVDDDR